ncbi:hypothetical protein KSS87_006675 [Heliosperma pusillum]|nr:hypothetical protein KSS87_006675 [Heliosperma pusillum]
MLEQLPILGQSEKHFLKSGCIHYVVVVLYFVQNQFFISRISSGCCRSQWCYNCFSDNVFCFNGVALKNPTAHWSCGCLCQVSSSSYWLTIISDISAMDVSSDLTELGKTPVAVVSAGAKSILDIPRTLEYLETQGVCVAGYRTNEFPAFFTETSGCKDQPLGVGMCTSDPILPSHMCHLLRHWEANMKLKLGTGILIAVPIPKEHSASGTFVESAIQQALKEAREKNITGSAETPFLLSRVNELTGGASLASNIALVKNNATIGSKIAVCLAQLGGYDGDDKS